MKSTLPFLFAALLILVVVARENTIPQSLETRPRWIAHRGVHQTFDLSGVDDDTCTAARIRPLEHDYLENTIRSMRAAFDAGAEAVELDLHGTLDGHLVVFHDAGLECRTEATGRPEDHTLAELQTLDLGYGYTADGGRSFPLRGSALGSMPSLQQVLDAFPVEFLVLHLKSGRPEDGRLLAEILSELPAARRERLLVYGSIESFRAERPGVRSFDREGVKRCLVRSLIWGWTGHVPESCRDSVVVVPIDMTRWLWGWPGRFQARMTEAHSEVILMGPWRGNSSGIDDPFMELPSGYRGWIWTDRVEVMARNTRSDVTPADR